MSNDSKEFALSQEIFEIGEECDVIQRIATDRFLRADEATQQLKTDDFFQTKLNAKCTVNTAKDDLKKLCKEIQNISISSDQELSDDFVKAYKNRKPDEYEKEREEFDPKYISKE